MAGDFAHGTILTVGAAIANLESIEGPTISMDTIDVTTHDSEDGIREFVGGLIDGGEVNVTGNFTAATQASALITLMENRTKTVGATIVFPTTPVATATFDCLVTAVEVSAPHDGKIEFSATFKVTGGVAYTPAT